MPSVLDIRSDHHPSKLFLSLHLVRASGNENTLYSHGGYDDPTITLEMKTLSKSAEAAACASPPLEPPPNYDELEFISPTQRGDATASEKL